MPAQTYLIYDNKTQTYSYTDLAGYNAWLNGIDIKPIASVPGSAVFDTTRPRNINTGDPFYNPLSVDSNATVVGGNQNLSISSVNNQTVGFQQLVQPGDGNGEIVFQRANSGGQIGDQERVDIGGPGVLGLGQLRLRSIDIVQDVSIKDDENVSTGNQPVNLAADQGYPDTSAAKRSGTVVTLESIDATAADLVTPEDIEGLNIPAGKLLKGDIVSVSEQTAIEGGYIAADPKISLERLPELAPKDYTTWSTRALILVATSPDTFGPYLALVQAELDRRGIPPDAYTTKLQQEITFTPLEAALGPRSSQVEGPPITAAQVEATVSNNQDLLDAWISAIGSESFQPATPTSIDFWRQNGWTLPEDLTLGPGEFFASAAMISEAKDSGIKFDVSGIIGTTRSGNPVYIVKNISGFNTDQEADAFWYTYAIKDVLKTVAQGINPERTEFGGSFDWFADARNPKGEGQIRTSLEAPDPLAADSTLVQELVREVNQEIQNDPAVLQAVTALQGALRTEADVRAVVSAGLSEYFGINNPAGQSLVDRVTKLISRQIPGVETVQQTAALIGKLNQVADTTLNSSQLSTQDILLELGRIVVTQFTPVGQVISAVQAIQTASEFVKNLAPAAVATEAIEPGGGGGSGGEDVVNFDPVEVDAGSDQTAANANNAVIAEQNFDGSLNSTAKDVGGTYVVEYDENSGTYAVISQSTGTVVSQGLSQNQANSVSAALNDGDTVGAAVIAGGVDSTGLNRGNTTVGANQDPSLYPNGVAYDDNGNLNPGWSLDEDGNPVYVGGDFVEPATQALSTAALQQALTERARQQATIQAQRSQANDGDWRVRLRLAPQAQYLYKAPGNVGILQPLQVTDGVIFPYTPQIDTSYNADYNEYNLTHSNYRGYFYKNSYVGDINLRCTFTAQDSFEATYLLAVIHFFRSVTKMFYGQDPQRGAPPPLVFLEGLGEFQFNLHPCIVKQFSYVLPQDVDYIRARSPNIDGTNLLQRRDRQILPTNVFDAVIARLNAAGLPKGGNFIGPPAPAQIVGGINKPTYVPTKIDINLTMSPIQSREQVSKQFSLKDFANGNLLRGGFW